MKDPIYKKSEFDISDFAAIVNRESQTIRSWERLSIIPKPSKDAKGWRIYSRKQLIECLEHVLCHPWKRDMFSNLEDIKSILIALKKEESSYSVSKDVEEK